MDLPKIDAEALIAAYGDGAYEQARREARKMLVGKTGFGPSCKQDDINALMVGLAKQGKRVVRLKGGDPLIFGRAAEEIAACQAAASPSPRPAAHQLCLGEISCVYRKP